MNTCSHSLSLITIYFCTMPLYIPRLIFNGGTNEMNVTFEPSSLAMSTNGRLYHTAPNVIYIYIYIYIYSNIYNFIYIHYP